MQRRGAKLRRSGERGKQPAFPALGHNHRRCAAQALAQAEIVCAAKRARLTAPRREVLALVWSSHAPIGAYDILSRLNADGGRTAPMAVYRALEFLMKNGLVHRIASLNAFMGCSLPGTSHAAQFLICRGCGNAAELENERLSRVLAQAVAARGFAVDNQIVEISGLCSHCGDGSGRRPARP